MRFSGVVLSTTCWIPGTGWSMGVSVQVGLTTFTRISFSMLSVAVLPRYLREYRQPECVLQERKSLIGIWDKLTRHLCNPQRRILGGDIRYHLPRRNMRSQRCNDDNRPAT
jgi:hypothetical protein